MSINLENLLINKIEKLTKFRQFYYEFMIVDDKNGKIIITGEGKFDISQYEAIDEKVTQKLKNNILRDIRQKDSRFLDFSEKNIVLAAILELAKPLKAKKTHKEIAKLYAEFANNISTFFQTNSEDDVIDLRKVLVDIYVPKIFDIYKQLMHNPMNGEREVLKNEIIESLHHLPQRIQQLLLDFLEQL